VAVGAGLRPPPSCKRSGQLRLPTLVALALRLLPAGSAGSYPLFDRSGGGPAVAGWLAWAATRPKCAEVPDGRAGVCAGVCADGRRWAA
jgi:hypothetical protein